MVTRNYNGVNVIFHTDEKELTSSNLVYILKFPNGKYYVGQTVSSYGLVDRVRKHCAEAFNSTKKTNLYKNNIIKKYKKIDVFILHKCKENEDIDFFEVFYINIFSRMIINIECGGNKNKKISEETKAKMSNSSFKNSSSRHGKVEVFNLDGTPYKVFNNTLDASIFFNTKRKYISRACMENFLFGGRYQFRWEKSNKNVIDLSCFKNKNGNTRWKTLSITINGEKNVYDKLYKYDENGYLLDEINVHTLNNKEINGIRQSIHLNTFYKGNYWSLVKKDKIEVPKKRYEKVSEKKSKEVLQLDDNLEILKKWKSITDASKTLGISNIHNVCEHERRHAGGFVWCYPDEYETFKKNWHFPLCRKRKDTIKGKMEYEMNNNE